METKDIIKAGRQRLGMTYQAFSDAVGVSRWAVHAPVEFSVYPYMRDLFSILASFSCLR